MTTEEIIKGIKDKGWSYTQPYRRSLRDSDSKWVFEVIDDDEQILDTGKLIDSKEGTREEMYEIYNAVVKGVHGETAT